MQHTLPVEELSRRHGHGHAVQFYEDDSVLCRNVADFVAEGIAAGRSALVIATDSRRARILEALAARGVEVSRARAGGQLVVLDARETLDLFMVGGRPDVERFRAALRGVIERAADLSPAGAVCAFGEMVDLLWMEGNADGALALEALWNDLAVDHPFHLLCGYALAHFADAADAEGFRRVCALHDRVIPTERYLGLDEEARLREISQLQQRALALETEVAYRKVLEQRLRGALAEAESASRAKSEFLAVMSHELRTPLNAIAGYAELMEIGIHGPVTPAQRDDLRRIRQSQRHLLTLIEEVLDYGRFEAGTADIDLVEVPAAEALAAAAGVVAPQARAKELALRVERCDPALVVVADAARLRQILTNLLANAVKFTAAGGRVALRCDRAGGSALFRVSDTGIGIEAAHLESIFEPFVQVSSDLTRCYPGTGLGLAISRDLARAMGGDITVESAPGAGSTFSLRLPLAAGR